MKTIIAFVCALAITSAALTTLISDNSVTLGVDISANSSNSSNVDVAWTLDFPDTLPTEVVDGVNTAVCFTATDSNFTIANSATAINVWAAQWICSSSGSAGDCDSITKIATTFGQSSGAAGLTDASGAFSTGTMTANAGTFTANSNTTTNVATNTISGVTASEMTAQGLPNTTETMYFRCFGDLGNATTASITTGITGVAAALNSPNNVTLKGSSSSVAAILAVAGSLVASFTF